MGRTENEIRRTQEAGSPLRDHSMNQHNLGLSFAGDRRMAVSKKMDRRKG